MSRNRDIRGFFGKGTSRGGSQPQPGSSSQPARDLQPSISSPMPRPKPTPKPRDRSEEIKGSDDDDDSDDSLESISAFIQRKNGPAPYRRDTNMTTPKAKRIAPNPSSLLKSPLTIQPKHKFDLQYLIDHTRQSDRADESARRADELINQSEDDDDHDGQILTEVQNDPDLLQKTAKELLDNNEEDSKGDKLVRAMNRTKVDGSQRMCYFFSLEPPLFKPPRRPFPEKKAKGCWQCLADSRTRDQAIILGLPHAVASKGRRLPDELFLWVLDEVCAEKNAQLRMQYCNLLTLCPESITRLVTDVRLYSMLERLGGPKYSRSQNGTKLQTLPKVEDPYPRRDWSGLVAFLELLGRMAPDLSAQNVIGAIKLLLRMGLDPLVSTTVRSEHAVAMEALVMALPKTQTPQWDEACDAISSYLNDSVDNPMHLVVPINHMPKTNAKLLDLRRRMAAVALFRDTDMGCQPVDEYLTLADIMQRLEADDFRIGPNTDFDALRALVTLLDIVIGGARFIEREHQEQHRLQQQQQQQQPEARYTRSKDANSKAKADADVDADADAAAAAAAAAEADAEAVSRSFDASIDALTFRLKVAHDRIHDSTLLSRKVAKASIDLVAKRLTYAVRTRPPPKTSIFDHHHHHHHHHHEQRREAEADIPRQRAFMKNWALRRGGRGGGGGGDA